MNDYNELKRLAEAATPGPWKWNDHGDLTALGLDDCSAVLRYEVYEGMWFGVYDGEGSQNEANKRLIEAANPAAVLALIAENEALRNGPNFRAIQSLRQDCEALRKDAERYRWLRAQHWDSSAICCVVDPKLCTKLGSYCPSLELLDQAVDAGLKLSKESPNG